MLLSEVFDENSASARIIKQRQRGSHLPDGDGIPSLLLLMQGNALIGGIEEMLLRFGRGRRRVSLLVGPTRRLPGRRFWE